MTATACPLDGQRGLELKLDELPGGKENPPAWSLTGSFAGMPTVSGDRLSRQMNEVFPLIATLDQRKQAMVLGTVLTREWNGQLHRVMVVEGGFAFEGKTLTACPRLHSPSPARTGMDLASLVLRDVVAPVRATIIRNVCAQLIDDRQPKKLPHFEMSRVERGPQVTSAIRHSR